MAFALTTTLLAGVARTKCAVFTVYVLAHAQFMAMLLLFARSGSHNDAYNMLWIVVFGFATINIIGLAARRYESNRRGLSFGELMAVVIVVLSVFLLGSELLNVFRIFPIKIQR